MEDNSLTKSNNLVDTTLSTKIDIETAGPSKEVKQIEEKTVERNTNIPEITQDSNNDQLLLSNKTMECSSTIDKLLGDNNDVDKTSQAVTDIELDAATEAKLLNEDGDAESVVNNNDDIAKLLDEDTETAGNALNQSSDDLEKLWYDSDDDTLGAENISSAIALLTDDVMNTDSVDAVTEEKLLADSVDVSTADKDILSTTGLSAEDTIEDTSVTKKIQMDNMDDNAMQADNNVIDSLSENKTENSFIEDENSGIPDVTEESVDKGEILNQIDSSNTKNTDPSEKSISDTGNINDAKSYKDDVSVSEDTLLDAKTNSDNQQKTASDEVQELDEEELLEESQENINKIVNIDMIGQSIKAVLETGRSNTCKNIQTSIIDSKEKDKVNTTADTSDNIEALDDSIAKEAKIDDEENNTIIGPKNKEIIQNIDKDENISVNTEMLEVKTNVEIQENTKDAKNTTTPDILDQDNTVTADSTDQDSTVTADSSISIENSSTTDNDNLLQSNNSNLDILKVEINPENTNNEEKSSLERGDIHEDIEMDNTDKQNNEAEDTAMQCNAKVDTSMNTNNSSEISTDEYPIHKKSSHNLHLPDAMLEIPTQELIDIDDVLDSPNDSKVEESFNKSDEKRNDDIDNDTMDVDKNIAETNCEKVSESKTNIEKKAPIIEQPQPSTSTANKFTPDTFDDMPETSDSLGLLAESKRVHDEDDDDDDGVHDDDEFEQDESSNQMTGEHSEDSNTHHSETEQTKYEEKDTREEAEDRVSNESDGDFDEEQSNLDAVEIEEHCVDIDDGGLKDGGEKDDEAGKEDEGEEKDGEIKDDIDKVEDLQGFEKQTNKLKVENLKDNNLSNKETINCNVNDKILEKDKQLNEKIATENTSDLTMVTQNAVKDTSKDIKEVKITKGIEKDKDSVTKDIKESSEEQTVEKSNELKQDNVQDPDVVDQTPEIPTYNLSDSDDEVVTSNQNKNKRKTIDSPSPVDGGEVKKKLKNIDSDIDGTASPTILKEHIESIVDLEESSEDDVTTVNKPTNPVATSTGEVDNTPGIVKTKENTVVKARVSQTNVARLNTSEVAINASSSAEQQTLVVPEKQIQTGQADVAEKPKVAPVYSIDSDEEETEEQPKPKRNKKCINQSCSSDDAVFRTTDNDIILYYDASRKRRPMVCKPCVDAVISRKQSLIDGIKDMVPLTELDMGVASIYPVEILDSDSEDEETHPLEEPVKEAIGEMAAKFLEENLADMLNSTWKKYNLDERLKETQDEINNELSKFELESKEINDMLNECQRMTDKLRTDLYATFEPKIQSEPAVTIYETPEFRYIGPELGSPAPPPVPKNRVINKRKLPTSSIPPLNKRPSVIPLGYAPINDPILKVQESKPASTTSDDDKDVSVVKLSAESPPPDLPPPGELVRVPLKVDMEVYAMKNAFGPWLKGRITEIMPKGVNSSSFTSCRVQFDHITKANYSKVLHARCIAYSTPPNVRMTIGTRLIALFKGSNKDSNKKVSFSSGVVAEAPTPVNNYRYLVFFDDGYAQYVKHPHTRIVCECSPLVWEEVHPFSRDFIKEYLMAFPERPMVRLHQGQNFKTEWNGKWWASRVLQVDASLVQVMFIENGRTEWIYRGSTRLAPLYVELQAAERHRTRASGTRRQPPRNNMPYVEYTRSEEQGTNKILNNLPSSSPMTLAQQKEELRKQRAVAKKSTMPAQAGGKPASEVPDSLTSRVVYYTPKNAVRPYKLVPHKCSPQCRRRVLSLEDLRTYNPLAKPLLSGWERQTIRFKGQKEVMYRAPCGRRLRNMTELHRYLQMTESELSVDLFDFYYGTHCLAEFQIYKCLTGKKDLSQGKENVPIPCVNYYDHTLPEFCSYNTERTPTSGVPLNLDPEFLCGCDCTDDCEDKTKCACWKMTLEGARTIGLDSPNIGYEYKRLPEPLPSGIYECNSRCKCKNTCLNRVAQHPLQLKLQVFKTLNRGWGIRALNDVPKGAFLCVYAGNLLTDATANLDGLNEGDEYLAELDYIEVVEQMKEGYEADIPDEDKKLDAEESASGKQEDSAEEASSSSEEEETSSRYDKEDDDFRPACNVAPEVSQFSKRLRKRSRDEEKTDKEKDKDKDKTDENFITISDDEEAREPSRFAAQTGMDGNELISKHRSVRSYFGEDEACYIMDAKVQGNIGRYLNHSCSPNVFVQNVFVDTHDPRFPWVAFFALSHIKAGTELTWNYNYDVGSVPDKILYCYCQAPNCRGRLL